MLNTMNCPPLLIWEGPSLPSKEMTLLKVHPASAAFWRESMHQIPNSGNCILRNILPAPEMSYLPSCCMYFSVGRVPDEPQADMTTSPASSGENLGLFMLRKDSERRDTLHRILTEYMSNVVQNIQETLPQVRSHTTVSPDVFDVKCCHTTSVLS